MDSAGNNKWISSGYNPENTTSFANCIAAGSNGTIAVSGEFFNKWKWDNFEINQQPPVGQINAVDGMYVAFLDPVSGAITGMDSLIVNYGYANRIMPQRMQTDRKGNFYISGAFYNPSEMPNTLTTVGSNVLMPVGGDTDFFMMKYGQNNCSDTVLSITENTANNTNVLLYPNPASTEIYFDIPTTENKVDLEIYNTLGSLVFSQKKYVTRSAIDIHFLSTGIYYCKITTNKNQFVRKLVKE
jgi:hypothetical protein